MYRVLLAFILVATAVQLSGCTGSLRLGGHIPVFEHTAAV
jgi:hypothetical protein